MTLASYITLTRIILIFPIILLSYLQESIFNYLAFILFLISGFTDYLDGYIARKTDSVTDLGALLDLLADKLLVCLVLIWLIFLNLNLVFICPVLIIIARELVMSSARQFIVRQGIDNNLNVSYLGKSKTTMQFICISLFLISPEFGDYFYFFCLSFLWLVSIITLYSMFDYARVWIRSSFD
tara:strand:- start:282 stop:827 length:546 start_codon:yes stop_codon:yes gene_type:complete